MISKNILAGPLVIAALAFTVSTANAEVTLKVQTSTKSGGFTYQYLEKNWVPLLPKVTNGEVSIQLTPINSVIPRKKTADGVAVGVLQGDLTSIAYFSGRNPAFAILGDLIAGYDTPAQVQQFCKEGGGEQALQDLWDSTIPNKIHVVGCGAVSKEALVSKVPLRGVADLKGLKIRSPSGLAATVFKDAGAAPANISFSDVYTSLEKGVVDAADASAYVNNDKNGFHQIARYPLYPGIHSMAVHQFTINQKVWDNISTDSQVAIKKWFYDGYAKLLEVVDVEDKKLVERDIQDPNITVINWSQTERSKFRKIATQAWETAADKTPQARVALDAHLAFMKKIGLL